MASRCAVDCATDKGYRNVRNVSWRIGIGSWLARRRSAGPRVAGSVQGHGRPAGGRFPAAAVAAATVVSLLLASTACQQAVTPEEDPTSPTSPDPPSFAVREIADRKFPVDVPIEELQLPAATGGAPPLRYELLPEIPGLSFVPRTRILSGTPTTADRHTMTYRAIDDDGAEASISFEVAIIAPIAPEDDHGDTPETATAITPGTPQRGRIEAAGDVDYFRVAVRETSVRIVAATSEGTGTVVSIDETGEDATADDHLAEGGLPAPRPEHVHIRVSGRHPADYELAVWVIDASDPQSGDKFDIEFRYLGAAQPSPAQEQAFAAAAQVWQRAITAGLPDLPVPTSDWQCAKDDPDLFGDYVDDLLIFVRVAAIDGAGGAVAQSTICARRAVADGGLPFIGSMTFDAADLADLERHEFLQPMVMHQMAHVLGFGLLWDEEPFRLLEDPSVDAGGGEVPGRDSSFAGERAIAAFDEAGGDAHRGAKVPVENDTRRHDPGVLDVHWRESVFDTELMSTTLNAAAAPLSAVTIASLEDLGYEVDATRADGYLLPAAGGGRSARTAVHGHQCGVRAAPVAVADLPRAIMRSFNRG